jgi:hypothetical protein
MNDFFNSGVGFAAAVLLILAGIFALVFGCMFGAAEWNKHNAPISFAACAKACGPAGVHRADPDFKCECNETHRIEGRPSLDLNIHQQEAQ